MIFLKFTIKSITLISLISFGAFAYFTPLLLRDGVDVTSLFEIITAQKPLNILLFTPAFFFPSIMGIQFFLIKKPFSKKNRILFLVQTISMVFMYFLIWISFGFIGSNPLPSKLANEYYPWAFRYVWLILVFILYSFSLTTFFGNTKFFNWPFDYDKNKEPRRPSNKYNRWKP